MQILITTSFIDRQARDAASVEVQAGTTMTVSVARGAELIALELATAIAVEATATPRAKPPRRTLSKTVAPSAPVATPTSPDSIPDTAAPAAD